VSANSPTSPEASYLSGHLYPPTYQLVRHIVSFLKWRFSLLPSGGYQWKPETENTPDQAGSEVFISTDTPINPQQVGARPAITVQRSAASFQGAGIGDWAFTQLSTGMVAKMDIIPTNFMVNVLSRLPVEAERLAWFCAEQIWTMREEITRSEPSILYTGGRPSLSPPTPAGAFVESTDYEWTVVVVSFPAYLQHTTTKLPLNKKILSGVTVTGSTPSYADKVASAQAAASVAPLQGTALNQPNNTRSNKAAALRSSGSGGGAVLPQTGSSEAQSSEPLSLTVEIDTE
jgi:hypothetical protein